MQDRNTVPHCHTCSGTLPRLEKLLAALPPKDRSAVQALASMWQQVQRLQKDVSPARILSCPAC